MKCKKCDTELHDGEKFCPNCGISLDKKVQASVKKEPLVLDKANKILIACIVIQVVVIAAIFFFFPRNVDDVKCPGPPSSINRDYEEE